MKTLTTFVVAVLMAAPAACDAVPALDRVNWAATDDEGRVAHWWSETREVAEGPRPPLDQDG